MIIVAALGKYFGLDGELMNLVLTLGGGWGVVGLRTAKEPVAFKGLSDGEKSGISSAVSLFIGVVIVVGLGALPSCSTTKPSPSKSSATPTRTSAAGSCSLRTAPASCKSPAL